MKSFIYIIGMATMLLVPCRVCAQVTSSFTEPFSTSEIASSESGIIAQTLVREGDKVTRGQLLARLNTEVLQQTLRIAKLRAKSDAKSSSGQSECRAQEKKTTKP